MLKPLSILIDADLADLLHAFTYFFDFSLGLLVSPHVVSWPLRYHKIPKPKKCNMISPVKSKRFPQEKFFSQILKKSVALFPILYFYS